MSLFGCAAERVNFPARLLKVTSRNNHRKARLIQKRRNVTRVCVELTLCRHCFRKIDSSMEECLVNDRKIADPWFDSRMRRCVVYVVSLEMCRCVLGKDTLRSFSIGAKQSTGYCGPA